MDPDWDLAALKEHLERETEGSPEREAYLAKLKKQIESGEYQVDSEALAKKLLEEARQRREEEEAK